MNSKFISAALVCFLTTSVQGQMMMDLDFAATVDGETQMIGMTRMSTDPSSDNFNMWRLEDGNQTVQFGGAEVEFTNITYSENPFITFEFSVTDIGAPSTFDFSFSTPITLAAGPTEVASSIGGSITDGSDSLTLNGATLSPNSPNSSLLTADVDGTALANAELGFTDVENMSGLPRSTSFEFNTGSTFLPGPTLAAAASSLRVNIDFTLTGDSDSASMNGGVDINAVPEPSTYTLIAALGAASFVFIFRKRK